MEAAWNWKEWNSLQIRNRGSAAAIALSGNAHLAVWQQVSPAPPPVLDPDGVDGLTVQRLDRQAGGATTCDGSCLVARLFTLHTTIGKVP